MKKTIILFYLLGLLVPFATQASNKTVSMGIFPYVSTSKLIAHHKHLKEYIDKVSPYKLSLVTAKNPKIYISRTLANKYDIIYSPPHLARFLEKKHGFQRVAMTRHNVQGIFLVRKESNITKLADLKNKTLSVGPTKTILHQIALKQLADIGLVNGKNITVKTVNTHNNAIYDVVNSDSDAAVTGIKIWFKLNERYKKQLRPLVKTDPTAGFILMARPGLEATKIKQIQDALLSFNDSIAGKKYLFKGFTLVTDEVMKSLDYHSRIFE